MAVVSYLEGDVGVAAENQRDIMFLAEPEELQAVCDGDCFLSLRSEGVVVDFQQRVRLFRGQHQLFEIHVRRAVTRVADDMYLGIANDGQHPLSILVFVTPMPTVAMDAGNADVQAVEVFVVKVQAAFCIKDVDFAPHQQSDAVHPPWHHEHVPEIKQGACAGDARPMLRDAQHLQAFVCRSLSHFLQAAVGMAAHDGVRVNVK